MRQITKDQFLFARSAIIQDINRELELARVSNDDDMANHLKSLGVTPGGGNFMAALAMLCYTEFAGGIVTGKDTNRINFDTFFARMGPGYVQLLESGMNVYKLFRCGMAHEYFAKKSIQVTMFGKAPTGLGELQNGCLFFTLDQYFTDFLKAFDTLGRELGFL